MTRRERFIEVALSMDGTPFKHQGRVPGVGVDCAGLVVCAAKAVGIPVDDVKGYSRIPSSGMFLAAIRRHCDRIDINDAVPGDIAVFAFRAEPQHVAIITAKNPLEILHAYMEVGRVVRHRVDDTWMSRLHGVYRIKGLDQ